MCHHPKTETQCPQVLPILTALHTPAATEQLRQDSRLLVVGHTGEKHLLPGTEFDCEGTTAGIHLEGCGLAAGRGPAPVLAVNEELPDLLGHSDVVHHHGQLGIVHRALLCQAGEQKRHQQGLSHCRSVSYSSEPPLANRASSQMRAMEQAMNIHSRSTSHYLGFVLGLGEKLFMLMQDHLS